MIAVAAYLLHADIDQSRDPQRADSELGVAVERGRRGLSQAKSHRPPEVPPGTEPHPC